VYDANGNLLSTTTPPPSGSGSGLTTTFQYDSGGLGELIKVTDPKGNSTTLAYTQPGGTAPSGLVASITDAQSNTTTFTYDGRGNRLTSVDALNNTTTYTYDSMNRLTKITAPDQTYTQFAYDYRGRRTSVTDANGKATQYQYDDADRLVAVTDAASNVTVYGYDTENNMVDITNAANHQTNFAYDALGRVTQVTFPSTLAESYTYDAMNNLLTKTDRKQQTISYGYDALYRLTSKTYPDSTAVNYVYDVLSRLTQVSDPSGTYTFGYDNIGRLVGTGTQYSFLSSALNNSYTYDAAGNRITKTAVQQASPNPVSVTSNYSYDPIYELTQAVVGDTLAEGYSYDGVGNRLTSAGPTSYNYNASNELTSTSVAAYAYDNNGNTTSKTDSTGTTNYSWDYENRLTSVTLPGAGGTVNFKYDPFGRRIEKIAPTSGTTIYAYDGDNVVEELGGGGNLLAHYTQGAGIDEPLAATEAGGTYFYHADGLGSITSLTDGSGQLAASYVYDSFGKLTASTGTITNPFQYTGREFDSETGLYYYRTRYYNTELGRFLSEDPAGFQGGDANMFRFVRNRPTAFSDPSGLLTIDPAFRSDCLPALKQALDIVRNISLTNKTCNCAYKQIGSGRSLSDLLNDPNIMVDYSPKDRYIRDANGKITAIEAAHVFPNDTSNIFIRPYTCRMGRWALADALVHELVHLTKGSPEGDDEQLPEDMEILCGTTKPKMSFTR
jgi:RHS repeat-associated protein